MAETAPMKSSGPYITPEELVKRWRGRVKLRTLENWRYSKKRRGPGWMRIAGRVLYPAHLVEEYEQERTVEPPKPGRTA